MRMENKYSFYAFRRYAKKLQILTKNHVPKIMCSLANEVPREKS